MAYRVLVAMLGAIMGYIWLLLLFLGLFWYLSIAVDVLLHNLLLLLMNLDLTGSLREVSECVVETLHFDFVLLIHFGCRCLLEIELNQLCSFCLVPYVISVNVHLMLSIHLLFLIISFRVEVSCNVNVTLWEQLLCDAQSDSLNYCEKE